KDAAQIAPAEKDRARAVPAAQAIFFAEMRKRAGHARKTATLADADLIVEPVNLAIAWANAARTQRFDCLLGALLQNAFLERPHVRGNKIFARQGKPATAA